MLLTIAFVLIVYLLWRSASLAQQLESVESGLHTLERELLRHSEPPVFVPTVPHPVAPVAEQPRPVPVPPPLPIQQKPEQPPPLPPEPEPEPEPVAVSVVPEVPAAEPEPIRVEEPPVISPEPPSQTWEELIGGNLLNKAGALILVIGIALFLGYSFTNMGPLGRSAIGLLVSTGILSAGVWLERNEQFRVFARGLIAAGWSSLYFTAYAMHAIDAAKIIDNPVVGLSLMVAVATGMVIHSLRYRVQSLTALAFACIYASLALSELNTLVVGALVPLAIAMLWLVRRFEWHQMTAFSAVATYAVFLSRGDTGAPLFAIQGMLLLFWLLFEAADLLTPSYAFAINAAAGIGASAWLWQHREPQSMWLFCCAASALYLISAILRMLRKTEERPALALSAALAALAIFAHASGLWAIFFLALEAQAIWLAGLYLGNPFLRILGSIGFAASLSNILLLNNSRIDVFGVSVHSVLPAMLLHAGIFYANRILRPSALLFGHLAAALVAASIGVDTPWRWAGLAWFACSYVLFEIGYRRHLPDFRYQGYAVALLGLIGTATFSFDPLYERRIYASAVAAVFTLAMAIRAARRLLDLPEVERSAIRIFAGAATPLLTGVAIFQGAPSAWWGVAWLAAAVLLLEFALWELPAEMLIPASLLAATGATRICMDMRGDGFAIGAAIALAVALRLLQRPQDSPAGILRTCSILLATVFGWAALWISAPHEWVPLTLAIAAVALAEIGRKYKATDIEVFGHLVIASASTFALITTPMPYWNALVLVAAHWYFAWRWKEIDGISPAHSWAALLVATVWLQANAVAGIAALALVLLASGEKLRNNHLRWQGYVGFAASFLLTQFAGDATLWTKAIPAAMMLSGALVTSRERNIVRSTLATAASLCTALLLFEEVSGQILTLSLGLEGIAVLVIGFVATERALRLNGLALLLICILKLFLYDLGSLETMYRIISFISLGVILLGVSWVYTRCKSWF